MNCMDLNVRSSKRNSLRDHITFYCIDAIYIVYLIIDASKKILKNYTVTVACSIFLKKEEYTFLIPGESRKLDHFWINLTSYKIVCGIIAFHPLKNSYIFFNLCISTF